MRILLANKFYYNRGGDCTYTIDLQQLLEAHGHEVDIFAMDFPDNLPKPWQKYFPSEVNFRNIRHPFEAFTYFIVGTCIPILYCLAKDRIAKSWNQFRSAAPSVPSKS